MGTRSTIAIARPRGYHAIYCHWDGYPGGVGAILLEHYSDPDPAKREALIALGDISSLRPEIGEKHPFDLPPGTEDPHPTWTVAYGRDRGETGIKARKLRSWLALAKLAEERGTEWLYVWLDETWLYTEVWTDPAKMELTLLTEEAVR